MKKIDVIVRPDAALPSRHLRVGVYCRVSTDREDQLNSLLNQHIHYEQLVAAHDDWRLAGIYEDAGISASCMKERAGLDRLIGDCRLGKIDLVLTKSISRLSRNTCECIDIVRSFQDLGIHVLFEKEQIDTRTMEGELLLSILSSMAQDEARSISENCRWTVRRQFEEGAFRLSRPPYGYQLSDGLLQIDPQEAPVVQEIFRRCADGEGTPSIAASLNEENIPTKRGGVWSSGTILHMIRNELYTGDLRMQKTWRDDRYHIHLNHGEQNQYYYASHHPALISPELFRRANEAASRRDTLLKRFSQNRQTTPPTSEDSYSHSLSVSTAAYSTDPRQNRYCCTGKLICAHCGNVLLRKVRKRTGGQIPGWICRSHHQNPASCPGTWHPSAELQTAWVQVLHALAGRHSHIPEAYLRKQIETVDIRLPLLEQQETHWRKDTVRLQSDYTRNRQQYILAQQERYHLSVTRKHLISRSRTCRFILQLQERLQSAIRACGSDLRQWIVSGYSDALFRDLIDHVTIDEAGEIYHFQCGLIVKRNRRGGIHEVCM